MQHRVLATGSLLLAACEIFGGCGSFTAVAPSNPVTPTPVASVAGRVLAGQHGVAGAMVTLYAAGQGGNGRAAQSLLPSSALVTDSGGTFQLPESYTCPGDTAQVYVVAHGGNPGPAAWSANGALTLVAALGDCKALSGLSSIVIDEATTATAAWALTPFAGAGANIGATATNLTGIRNAFHVAANLVSATSGTAPGALPEGGSTEVAKINTLANALAGCAYSNGGTGCQALFNAAGAAGVAPSNTFDAALNIVRNPASQVAAVAGAALVQTPYQPALTAAPRDWTLSLTYGKCGSGCGGLSSPTDLAVDQGGNVWVANNSGAVVSEFSPWGVAAAAQGFPGAGLRQSYGIAVDAQGNVWVANQQSVTAANNGHSGSVSKFSSSGTELSGSGFTGGGIYYPQSIAAGVDGRIWVANYGASSATLLAGDGSAVSGSGGYSASQMPFVTAVALDAAHNAWFAAQGVAVHVTQSGTASSYACCNYPTGVAVDASGDVWLADYNGYSIVELDANGNTLHRYSTFAGNTAPQQVAIDGAGNAWTSNYYGDSVTEIAGGAVVSPGAGLGLDAGLSEPYGIAIDASGGVWLSNAGNNSVTQLVGLASPVQTPLLGPPARP